jgi:hypothetical protein
MIDLRSHRRRAARFLRERYQHRERPCCFADLFLWTLMVIVATWPLLAVIRALVMLKWQPNQLKEQRELRPYRLVSGLAADR